MSVNKNKPHVLVLPEDDANRQLAVGFLGDDSLSSPRQIQVLEVAGGWSRVLDSFTEDHVYDMERFPNRLMLLLIDFDDKQDRLQFVQSKIPNPLTNRVFVLGTLTEPEDLKKDLGSLETIGLALARDCREGTDTTWSHRLLHHNAAEVARLREHVRPILFA
jgi:hypothetical protein